MSDLVTGGCTCGAIRYEVSEEPVFSWHCHCRDCQKATGTAYCAVSYIPQKAYSITGEATGYEVKAESGNWVKRWFCPKCGDNVFITAELVPDLRGIYAGSRDDPTRFKPRVEVWVGSKQPWDNLNPNMPLQPIAKAPNEAQFKEICG